MKEFLSPTTSLGDLDAVTVSTLAASASDVAIVVDASGIIRDIAYHNETLAQEIGLSTGWIGRVWSACVTIESRPKVDSLLHEALTGRTSRSIQVNHLSSSGQSPTSHTSTPVLYTAVPAGRAGNVVFLGRDLRGVSAMQQRLVDAQQSMERDYLRLRDAETRYRLLFEISPEAVVILEARSDRITEANPVAVTLLADGGAQLSGRPFAELFEADSRPAIGALLPLVKTAGRTGEIEVKTGTGGRLVRVSAFLFRQENASYILARLAAVGAGTASPPLSGGNDALLLAALEAGPDGFVVTEPRARILAANAAFLDMVQLAAEDQLIGGQFEEWLGRGGVDMNVMTANLRQRGSVRLFATTLRGRYGATTDVEISAASALSGGKACFGFTVRNVGRRLSLLGQAGRDIPRSVSELTELIGRVSLKELVREATDMIEKLGIEAALKLTDDNKASAAELLGLSRQSLYVKLRRHGLGDLGTDGEEQG